LKTPVYVAVPKKPDFFQRERVVVERAAVWGIIVGCVVVFVRTRRFLAKAKDT